MRIPLLGSSGTPFSVDVSAQSSINCYVESVESPNEKNKIALRGIPGYRLLKNLTTIDAAATPVRGFFSGGGRCFVAAGTKYFEIDSSGALVGSVRTIADDADHSPVTMIANGNQLLIVSAGLVYCDNGAGPVAITLPAFTGVVDTINTSVIYRSGDLFDPGMVGQAITINAVAYTVGSFINDHLMILTTSAGAQLTVPYSCTPLFRGTTGCFIDGCFVVNRPNSRQFNISALLDGTTWNQLDFGIKEGWPDYIVRVFADNELLYLFGTETSEAWRNTGNASFPFERLDSGVVRIGLAARWSPVSIAGKLYFLGSTSDGQTCAYRMDGATPTRVSTHAVEFSLGTTSFIDLCTAYSYQEQGHWFWVICTPIGKAWVYDVTESANLGAPQWHQRALSDTAAPYDFQDWPFAYHTFIPSWGTKGYHLIGDKTSGKIYQASSEFYDANSADIRAQRTMAVIYNEGKRIYHHRIDIENEAGLVSGAGNAPLMTLDWSDDRGHTFGTGAGANTSVTLTTGAAAAYSTRSYAVALGSSRWRNYRLTFKGQSKMAIVDASLEATEGLT